MRKYVNAASDEDFLLIVAWLVMALRPDGLYPILILQGEEASAKSTASRVLRALIDPQKAPIRAMPKTEHDLVIAATSSWVTAFDNGSSVRDQFSDALCRIATGGGFATRALYTDDEQRIFEQVRPVILNSLDAIATKQDLLDRAIVLRLPRIAPEGRKDEATFWQEFETDRPKIVAALFQGSVKALYLWDDTSVTGLRMADFARWTAAAMPAFGWTPPPVHCRL